MNLLSEAHLRKIYAQGVEAIVRLVHRLADHIDESEAHPIREPQPVIARLATELAKVKRTLARQSRELHEQQQLNHQLLRRIRELEREVEGGAAVVRDSHNSSLPPSSDPPWQNIPPTKSLRKKSDFLPGGQFGHRGTTLRQVAEPDQLIIHQPELCRPAAQGFTRLRPLLLSAARSSISRTAVSRSPNTVPRSVLVHNVG